MKINKKEAGVGPYLKKIHYLWHLHHGIMLNIRSFIRSLVVKHSGWISIIMSNIEWTISKPAKQMTVKFNKNPWLWIQVKSKTILSLLVLWWQGLSVDAGLNPSHGKGLKSKSAYIETDVKESPWKYENQSQYDDDDDDDDDADDVWYCFERLVFKC